MPNEDGFTDPKLSPIQSPNAAIGRRNATGSTGVAEPVRQPRLLLAEDHETNQLVAAEILRRAGYLVDVVSNGQLAVEARFQQDYRLILMDCHMPTMDGFEAARAIRRAEGNRTRAVPIIALTANSIEGDRENCLRAGMDDYLAKPVTASDLLAMIGKWVARPILPGVAGQL